MNSNHEQPSSRPQTPIAVFVGSTANLLDAEQARNGNITFLPPVGPGDVEKQVRAHPEPGVLAIVDGWFYQRGALSHEEIRSALMTGWRVWGLSSFGAIRAYDMRHVGMLGFGKVFEAFCDGDIKRDDEVLYLHAEEPPYAEVSEPFVNFKEALAQLVQRNTLSPEVTASILRKLANEWLGDRTLQLFGRLLSTEGGWKSADADAVLSDFERFRLGRSDLRSFLSAKPWIDQAAQGH